MRVSLLLFLSISLLAVQADDAIVVAVEGKTEIWDAQEAEWRKLNQNVAIKPGTAIRTGTNSSATIVFRDSSITNILLGGSELAFEKQDDERIGSDLRKGAVAVSLAPTSDVTYECKLPFSVVGLRPVKPITRALIRTPDVLTVESGQAVIVYLGPGHGTGTVNAGKTASSGPDIAIRFTDTPPSTNRWIWSLFETRGPASNVR